MESVSKTLNTYHILNTKELWKRQINPQNQPETRTQLTPQDGRRSYHTSKPTNHTSLSKYGLYQQEGSKWMSLENKYVRKSCKYIFKCSKVPQKLKYCQRAKYVLYFSLSHSKPPQPQFWTVFPIFSPDHFMSFILRGFV